VAQLSTLGCYSSFMRNQIPPSLVIPSALVFAAFVQMTISWSVPLVGCRPVSPLRSSRVIDDTGGLHWPFGVGCVSIFADSRPQPNNALQETATTTTSLSMVIFILFTFGFAQVLPRHPWLFLSLVRWAKSFSSTSQII